MMDSNISNDKKKTFITEGIVLATVPLIAYITSYEYESGFLGYFDIPKYFIKIDFLNVLIISAPILIFLILCFALIDIIYRLFSDRGLITKKVILCTPLFLMFLLSFFIYGINNWKEWKYYLALFLLIILFEFGPSFKIRLKFKSFEEEEKARKRSSGLFGIIGNKLGPLGFLIFYCLFFIFFIANNIGRSQAIRQTKYLIINSNTQTVVLRIYDDILITSDIVDSKTKTINNNFSIKKISCINELNFSQEYIGPLHLERK